MKTLVQLISIASGRCLDDIVAFHRLGYRQFYDTNGDIRSETDEDFRILILQVIF